MNTVLAVSVFMLLSSLTALGIMLVAFLFIRKYLDRMD